MGAKRMSFVDQDAEDEISAAMRLGAGVRIVEALLFASREPVSDEHLSAALPAGVALKDVIAHLETHYAARGVVLQQIGRGWTFRTAPDLAHLFRKEADEPRKLSRAAVETLAIIAYHQPVTRAEIEEIRGVATARGTLDVLLEAGFVRMRGRRRTPGRPITFGTTEGFLAHFGLAAIGDLPGLEELKQAGMFDGQLPPGLSAPIPSDDPVLRGDEDPLEADVLVAAAQERIDAGDEPLETGLDWDGPGDVSDFDRLDPLEGERRS